ncbi:hypothetical protein [Streptomyces sp. RLB3-6]|uniref:hypothetical protein n=1 Tax=Streptomyces sp. RLB3-6 TaxID=2594457 RepID=UPI001162A27A|nr:hypothetical protein [Streptomyces sp. RLB3-6]QDN93372.1 hypothetical protein FNV61_55675 [Streptomyces sp. RLB3-6]
MAGLPWLPQTGKALLGCHVSTLHPLGGGCEGGAQGSGKIGASLSAKAVFQTAFKGQYQHVWTAKHTESTSYRMTVKPGDALVFGASAAMQRIQGTLTTNQGQAVRNVIVDSPSTASIPRRSSRPPSPRRAAPPPTCPPRHPYAAGQCRFSEPYSVT